MGKYVMVVQSAAQPGRDDEYNQWYDSTHFYDICAIPGVKSGRRFEMVATPIGKPGAKYLAIYEIEADDPNTVLAEMGKRGADGRMPRSDSLDPDSAVMWIYKQR